MKMKVTIDPERCTGHGRCVALAPELFDFDEQGSGVVVCSEVPEAVETRAVNAVKTCPESAIQIDS